MTFLRHNTTTSVQSVAQIPTSEIGVMRSNEVTRSTYPHGEANGLLRRVIHSSAPIAMMIAGEVDHSRSRLISRAYVQDE